MKTSEPRNGAEVQMKMQYKRLPHLAPVILCVGMFAACTAYSLPVIAGFQNLWDLAYLLLLGTFGGSIGLAAYLSGRFLLRPQTISLDEQGLTATYLNGGQPIAWDSIAGISILRRGVLLHLPSSNKLALLFVIPALETTGLNLTPKQLGEAIRQYSASSGVEIPIKSAGWRHDWD
jgi:hypothetical protein